MITDTAELLGTFEVESPEWYAARATGLGGSEIAAVLGLSPWCSPFTLWHRKAGLIGPEQDNRAMSWGRRLEPVVAEKWADDHPEYAMHETGTWRHKTRTWQVANPDRLLYTPGERTQILEVKTAHSMDGWKWGQPGTDDIPVYYRTQCLWYMDVLDLRICHLIVLIGGSDDREYLIRYDETEALTLRHEAGKFLESIAAGDRPDIDSSDSTYSTVRNLHPDIDGRDKEIPPVLAADYQGACIRYDHSKKEKQQAVTAILDIMGEARYATCGEQRIAQRVAGKPGHPPHLRPAGHNNQRKA